MDDRYQLKPRLHCLVKHGLALAVIPQCHDQAGHSLCRQRAELILPTEHLLAPPNGPIELPAVVQQPDHHIAPCPL